MTSTMTFDDDWVKKFHLNNKVDLNLQTPVENESIKIEVGDIPIDTIKKDSNKNADSYLQSILSSPSSSTTTNGCSNNASCTCYKCQRQRRRANLNQSRSVVPEPYTPLKKIEKPIGNISPSNSFTEKTPKSIHSNTIKPNSLSSSSSLTNLNQKTMPAVDTPKRSNTVRKTPTLKSYEKHLPKPTYSQLDSIYQRFEDGTNKDNTRPRGQKIDLNEIIQQDNYKISWQDEGTGDDLLTSLVTFQTIFEENGAENNEGLSDLIEQKAKELKSQKLKQTEPEHIDPNLPAKRSDCLTLSFRDGPKHTPLTLFHTMKLKHERDRMNAYNMAFEHCIHADSGMGAWIKKQREPPTREGSKLIQPVRKPTIKRSLLNPLASRKNKLTGDDVLLWSSSSENLGLRSQQQLQKRSAEQVSSPIPLLLPENNLNLQPPKIQTQMNKSQDQLIDVISIAQTLVPNQAQFASNITPSSTQTKIPYEYIDTPSKPGQGGMPSPVSPSEVNSFKDTSSISSSESANGTSTHGSSKLMRSRTGRLFSSLGKKTSIRSHKSSYKDSVTKSLDKNDCIRDPIHEKVLDDLCKILPHIERSQLSPYVEEADNDYKTALQLCKAAVLNGKLT